jgi:hypothetical protein
METRALIKMKLDSNSYTIGDMIKIKYNPEESEIIRPLEDHINPSPIDPSISKDRISLIKYRNQTINAKFLGLSKIDGLPFLEINLTQLSREEKLDMILDGNG